MNGWESWALLDSYMSGQGKGQPITYAYRGKNQENASVPQENCELCKKCIWALQGQKNKQLLFSLTQ